MCTFLTNRVATKRYTKNKIIENNPIKPIKDSNLKSRLKNR